MPTKVFIGNLNNAFNREELGELFGQYGKLTEYDLVRNYGFVHFEREEDAIQAIKELNNKEHQGTELHVELSKCQHKTGKWNPSSSRYRENDDRQGYIARQRGRPAPYYHSRDSPRGRYPDREYSRPPYRGSPPPRGPPRGPPQSRGPPPRGHPFRGAPPRGHPSRGALEYSDYIQYPESRQMRGHPSFKEQERGPQKYADYEGFNRYEGYEGYGGVDKYKYGEKNFSEQ